MPYPPLRSSHSALESSPRSLLASLSIKLLVSVLHLASMGLYVSLKNFVGMCMCMCLELFYVSLLYGYYGGYYCVQASSAP
ncbi:hypothetical protein EON63_12410 [archaeon]|nr:MAG: hypothetical protein EON63_12410 [archaeon]